MRTQVEIGRFKGNKFIIPPYTVKGTARVFNLGHISSELHNVENKIVSIINKKEESEE